MAYVKRIVCFANSRKTSGRCVAGKEISKNGQLGAWIRPVSDRPTQEVSEEERRYQNGQDPRLLDIVEIQMQEHIPHEHQSENHLIDPDSHWINAGKLTWHKLADALDKFPGSLWIDGNSSYSGLNDRIPHAQAAKLPGSLMLLQPDELVVTISAEGAAFGNPKRKVRAHFSLGGQKYALAVTDPIAERIYLAKKDGDYQIKAARLCVSLGEAYKDGNCYKFVAGIILRE
jgi:hypothetical protein